MLSNKDMRSIPGYPSYFVCNGGFVYRHEVPLKASVNRQRYLVVSIKGGRFKKWKAERVHRLVCRAFNGRHTKGRPWALHKNGKKQDNRPENLYWGSGKQNSLDSIIHGTHRRGKGVGCTLSRKNKKWIGTICINRRMINVGSYHKRKNAMQAYKFIADALMKICKLQYADRYGGIAK